MDPNEALKTWTGALERNATSCLKLLLETKHLYQSVTVDLGTLGTDLKQKLQADFGASLFIKGLHFRLAAVWVITDRPNPGALSRPPLIALVVPDVKLYCGRCDRIEAFNSMSATDFSQRGFGETVFGSPNVVQIFALSFLWQSCKTIPEVFLVRREGSN